MNLEDDLIASNKWNLDEVEEISVDTFATAAHRLSSKKACNGYKDLTTSCSTQDPKRSLALI